MPWSGSVLEGLLDRTVTATATERDVRHHVRMFALPANIEDLSSVTALSLLLLDPHENRGGYNQREKGQCNGH
ncbi:hypothetical protein KF728_17735 [Candidatus Obscuribacterales bacterium]|nr:hypothetical protein [Candidatus Obscuribacterales bacterium]